MVPPAPHSSVPRVPDQTAGDAWDGTPRRARTGHGGLGCVSASAVYLHPMTLGPLLDTWATGHPEPRLSRTARAVVPLSAHRHQRPNSISPVPRSATPTFCAGSERATCCPESIQSGMRVMIKAPTSTVKGPCRGLDRASRTRSRRNRQSLRPRESVSRNGTVLRLHYDGWSRSVSRHCQPALSVFMARRVFHRVPGL